MRGNFMRSPNAEPIQIRDRVKELRRVRASELLPNPRNWRIHGREQARALRGLLQARSGTPMHSSRACVWRIADFGRTGRRSADLLTVERGLEFRSE